MIEINLLPHREAKRAADVKESVLLLVLGLILLAGGVYFANASVEEQLDATGTSVRQLEADIERYKPQQQKVAAFKKRKKELVDKLDIIKGLERARSGPVRVLDEIAQTTPERLWLTEVTTKQRKITLEGASLDTGVVADFLRKLNESKYFKDVDLDKTQGGKVVDGVRLVDFVIEAKMNDANKKQNEKKDGPKGAGPAPAKNKG